MQKFLPTLTALVALFFLTAAAAPAAPQWLDCDKDGGGETYAGLDEAPDSVNPGDPPSNPGFGEVPVTGDPGGGVGTIKYYLTTDCVLEEKGANVDPDLEPIPLADLSDFNTLKTTLGDANILGHAGNVIFKSEDGLQFRPFGTNHCTLELEGFDVDGNGTIEGSEVDGRIIHPDGTLIASEWVVPNGSILLRDADCVCDIITPDGAPIVVNTISTVVDNPDSLPYLERGYRLKLTGSLYRIEPHIAPTSANTAMRPEGTIFRGPRSTLLRTGQTLNRWIDFTDLILVPNHSMNPWDFNLPPFPYHFIDNYKLIFPIWDRLILPVGTPTLHIDEDCILKTDGTIIDFEGNIIPKPTASGGGVADIFWLDLKATMYRQVLHVTEEELPPNPTLRADGSIPVEVAVLLKHNGDFWLPGPTIQKANGEVVFWNGARKGGQKTVTVPKGLSF